MAITENRQKGDTIVIMNDDNLYRRLGPIWLMAEFKSPTAIERMVASNQSWCDVRFHVPNAGLSINVF